MKFLLHKSVGVLILCLFFAGTSVMSSCKKKEGCTDTAATNYDSDAEKDDGSCIYASQDATLMLHMHSKVGTQSFNYNQEYSDGTGRKYKFSRVQFYLSGFELHKDDGTHSHLHDTYLLVNPDQSMYSLGTIDPGHYHNLEMAVGVDSAANHKDPTTFASTHPLAPVTPSMHWSWNAGYKFIVLEGSVDTTANATGSADVPFVMHVGLDQHYREVSLGEHFDATAGEQTEIHIDLDFEKFFTGVDLRTERDTHTSDNLPLALKIADNAPSIFIVQ